MELRSVRLQKIHVAALVCGYGLCMASAHAQVLESAVMRRDQNDAVLTIRFVGPVLFQRAISAKSGDLIQVYYNTVTTPDVPTDSSSRLIAGRGTLPEISLADDASSREDPTKRKLVLRLSKSSSAIVRPGKRRETLDIVFKGFGDQVGEESAQSVSQTGQTGFAIVLSSANTPGEALPGSIPGDFQDLNVFTSRRVVDSQTLYETSIGYFETAEAANAALRKLQKRFPSAAISSRATEPAPAPTPLQAPAVAKEIQRPVEQPAPPASTEVTAPSSPEVEQRARQLWSDAFAASESGDYPKALTLLDGLLNLPPNGSTRIAQKEVGVIRLKQSDHEHARAEFETFLKLYPAGADSDEVRQYLANLPAPTKTRTEQRRTVEASTTTSGSVSVFYYGGQSQTRTQDFQESPLGGLPVLQSQSDLSNQDQSQVQTSLDLNWRHRDADVDARFVVRDSYSSNLLPKGKDTNRLAALYYENRNLTNGVSYKLGRQSPSGGGVLFRYDGAQVGYRFAPKWRLNAAYGIPTDVLLDTKRAFISTWVDSEALTEHSNGSLYFNQQTIDGEIDRSAIGTELRYFEGGASVSAQLDYDQKLNGLNTASLQGSWIFPDNSVVNFLLDRRATPVRSLSNILFFQDPSLTSPARTLNDLLATTPIDQLRGQVNSITSFQNQAMLGYNTPISEKWQTGVSVNYTRVDEIKPVAVILPNGQASTGDLWSASAMLIGSNLYSSRDTHVFNVTALTGPTYTGTLLSYNNLTAIGEKWQLEPYLRYYVQNQTDGTKTNRTTPGLRLTYRAARQVALESELSYEIVDVRGPLRTEDSKRYFYYLGGRYDF
jgi:tetratricopeptide (TPR) repeat protein